MALVNTLAIRLDAISSGFTAGINKATGGLQGFIQKNQSLGGVLRNLNGTIAATNPLLGLTAGAATAVGAAIAGAVAIGAKYADNINVVAKRTGFATDELSRLKFIAEQTETSFEDLAGGLKFLNKNLGEAQAGNKTAAKAFSDLGVAIKEVDGSARSSEDVFNDVRNALSGIENDAKRAALAQAIFGRSTFAILPFLRLTGKEIDALGQRAENLGLIVSEDFAKQSDAFGDNLSTIKGAALGLNNIIAARLLPGINAFLERIIEAAERFIPKFRKAFDDLVTANNALALSLQPIAEGLLPVLKIAIEQVGLLFHDLIQTVLEVAFIFDKLVVAIRLTVAEIVQLEARARGNKAGVAEMGAEIERLNKRLRQSLPDFKAAAVAFADVESGSSSTAEAIKKVGEETETTTGTLTENLTALQALTKSLEPIRDALEGGAEGAKSFAESLLQIGSPEAIAQYNALIAQLIKMGQAGDDASMRVARALIGAEGPEFPPEERARREAEFRAAGPQAPPGVLEQRQEDLRGQGLDVGPQVPENLERIPSIFGEIILLTEEAQIGFAALDTLAGGFGSALADVFSAKNKKAFIDFFKSLRDQIIAAIAKALILRAIFSILPGGGIFGGLGKLLTGKPFETPSLDAFAQSEGSRFGLLFGRGLRSTLGQTAFAGIGANLGTANVVIEPQIVVQNAGPLARVEWFERGQEQRLRRRQVELGGAPL